VEERRIRVGSLFEWIAAALGVIALIWMLSVPVQRMLGPRVEAALVEATATLPPGVPATATMVPLMILPDGREIRQFDLQSRLLQILPEKPGTVAVFRSDGQFGERQTRAYTMHGTKFYIVSERIEAGGPYRVSGIFLP
jgi:hypothetical protein